MFRRFGVVDQGDLYRPSGKITRDRFVRCRVDVSRFSRLECQAITAWALRTDIELGMEEAIREEVAVCEFNFNLACH